MRQPTTKVTTGNQDSTVFPLRGKYGPVFPQCGKYFSIAWKNREKVFHTVENSAGRDSPAAVEYRKNRLRDGYGRFGGGGALLVQRQQVGRGGVSGGLVCDWWPGPRKEQHCKKAHIFSGFPMTQPMTQPPENYAF